MCSHCEELNMAIEEIENIKRKRQDQLNNVETLTETAKLKIEINMIQTIIDEITSSYRLGYYK